MKQLTLMIVLLGVSFVPARAQQKPGAFIEVFGGLSRPLGSFAEADYGRSTSGFAKSGTLAGVSGGLFFGGNVGVGATLSQMSYGVNTFALADGYRADFAVDEATVSSRRYTLNNLLAGPYYSLSLGRLTLDLRGLVGMSAATLPAWQVALEDQSVFTQQKATATAFAWQVGAGVRAQLVKHVGLSLRADYLATRPDFAVTYEGLNNSSGRQLNRYHQSIASLNATLGIHYQFGN